MITSGHTVQRRDLVRAGETVLVPPGSAGRAPSGPGWTRTGDKPCSPRAGGTFLRKRRGWSERGPRPSGVGCRWSVEQSRQVIKAAHFIEVREQRSCRRGVSDVVVVIPEPETVTAVRRAG